MIHNSLSCLVESSRDLFGLSTFFVLLFISCDSENASDCFQDTGEITRQEVSVEEFTTITAFENITLVVKQADTQKVEIETGENLRNEVAAVVEDGRLLLTDTNDCNYIRDYGITVVYVTTPNLTSIRSSTGFPIQSDGVLAFESLSLLSESFTDSEAETTDGEFNLELDVNSLSITSNGISYFKLKGSAESFNISIAAGDSRVEADKLIAKRVNVNHRGSNDILVNPQESLTGVLRGTGDLQSYNRPVTVEVEELYNGRLIFVE
ncbi:putative autotransporter adhesin-like protein [Maribacter caenipelagi]|uniref:Putative autotransporter adhesin-like protein n=1 Tax=Maribacter caenipelagi TaxID=1447781 RepID=A0A4R7CTX0_9FLAO|nr:head GIN domain-containing protein [Maribacter caenipelagi]TDS10885.1 putative autotransporter adhesin-like protein [Maribacter caenipelagi]